MEIQERLSREMQAKRTPCSVYLRVMGYYSPIRKAEITMDGVHGSAWNTGKQSEGYSRVYFDEKKSNESLDAAISNDYFCDKY